MKLHREHNYQKPTIKEIQLPNNKNMCLRQP